MESQKWAGGKWLKGRLVMTSAPATPTNLLKKAMISTDRIWYRLVGLQSPLVNFWLKLFFFPIAFGTTKWTIINWINSWVTSASSVFFDRMKYMVFKGFLLYTTGTLTGKMEEDREATSSKGHPSALNWVGYQLIGQTMINTSLAVSRGLKPPKLFSQVSKVQYS